MRLAICALSAVLLSGCSWLGGLGGGNHQGHQAKSANYEYGGAFSSNRQKRAHNYGGQHNPCQISSPQQPIPRGCDPASVTLATPNQAYGGGAYGGFPQEPNFGAGYGSQHGGQYASHGYGSHAGVARQQAAHYQPRKQLRKPRWRGSMSMGFEKSISGNILDYTKAGVPDPTANYDPQLYNEGSTVGAEADGEVTTTTYTANSRANDQITGVNSIFTPQTFDGASRPDISYDDAHSTPFRIAGGIEYIANPRTTFFANAGYSFAEGENGTVASVNATGYRLVSRQPYSEQPVGSGIYGVDGAPEEQVTFAANETIATFDYDFSEMKRLDLELGGRHYFKPLVKDQGFRTLTPFVGASAGASHYNGVSYEVTQRQAHYTDFFDGVEGVEFYDVIGPSQNVTLYNAQWLASGQLNAGVEWQLTPKTALAFETGVRVEQGRKYANTGERGDTNVAIPLTIRGSYNF